MNARDLTMQLAEREEAVAELLVALQSAEEILRKVTEPALSGTDRYDAFKADLGEIQKTIFAYSPDDEDALCSNCQHDSAICRHCAGTGEGSHDGARCWSCKGSGKAS